VISISLLKKTTKGRASEKPNPNKRGYDWFYGLLQGSRGYFPYDKASPHRVVLENDTPTKEEGYVTDRFGDAACRFITKYKNDPFYLFVSFTSPHGPLQPKKALKSGKKVKRREGENNSMIRSFGLRWLDTAFPLNHATDHSLLKPSPKNTEPFKQPTPSLQTMKRILTLLTCCLITGLSAAKQPNIILFVSRDCS